MRKSGGLKTRERKPNVIMCETFLSFLQKQHINMFLSAGQYVGSAFDFVKLHVISQQSF